MECVGSHLLKSPSATHTCSGSTKGVPGLKDTTILQKRTTWKSTGNNQSTEPKLIITDILRD
ncbi:hypothetical protein AAMO2058_001238200 [Amorphochlora amoebiformis]